MSAREERDPVAVLDCFPNLATLKDKRVQENVPEVKEYSNDFKNAVVTSIKEGKTQAEAARMFKAQMEALGAYEEVYNLKLPEVTADKLKEAEDLLQDHIETWDELSKQIQEVQVRLSIFCNQNSKSVQSPYIMKIPKRIPEEQLPRAPVP